LHSHTSLANSDSNVKNKCFTSKPLLSFLVKNQIKKYRNKIILSYIVSISYKCFPYFDIFDLK